MQENGIAPAVLRRPYQWIQSKGSRNCGNASHIIWVNGCPSGPRSHCHDPTADFVHNFHFSWLRDKIMCQKEINRYAKPNARKQYADELQIFGGLTSQGIVEENGKANQPHFGPGSFRVISCPIANPARHQKCEHKKIKSSAPERK